MWPEKHGHEIGGDHECEQYAADNSSPSHECSLAKAGKETMREISRFYKDDGEERVDYEDLAERVESLEDMKNKALNKIGELRHKHLMLGKAAVQLIAKIDAQTIMPSDVEELRSLLS